MIQRLKVLQEQGSVENFKLFPIFFKVNVYKQVLHEIPTLHVFMDFISKYRFLRISTNFHRSNE